MTKTNGNAVEAKICGLMDQSDIEAAVNGGARYVGLVFYAPSPRAVTPAHALKLLRLIPISIIKVGLFVDPTDKFLKQILNLVPLDFVQLHGSENPDRVRTIKALTRRPVMKAIKVANREDVDRANDYDGLADMLLFDAKTPMNMRGALPGGNGLIFDWHLLADRNWQSPWMLSGGLNLDNVSEAVNITGASAVDVSSGVETAPGEKSPVAIKAFLDVVKTL